ncbi:MAG: signal peptidase I [Pirellulales bacterium]|nr:signal peptidase I [Pirellulales bacterium]
MNEPTRAKARTWRVLRWIFRQTERTLAVIGLAALIYWTCFDLVYISSNSMSPTLRGDSYESGDRVLSERVSFWFREPRRWEVITIRRPDGVRIMKRVVGLPGERIQMLRKGRILIDGAEISPPPEMDFLDYFPFGNLVADQTVDCGDGYYVLGDYSRDSDDSRFNGPISPHQILGRPWLILSPSDRRGVVR